MIKASQKVGAETPTSEITRARLSIQLSRLTRLSLFDPDSENFGAQWLRQVLEKPTVEPAKSAETACGADLAPCGTTGGFESLPPPCFCATKRVARTARSTVPGASSRTAGWLAGVRCSEQRWQARVAARFDVLLYDLTSTYFECDPPEAGQRRFGHSRDKRSDCVQ